MILLIVLIIGEAIIFENQRRIVKAELWALKYSGQTELDPSKRLYKELTKCEKISNQQRKSSWWYLLKVPNKETIKYFQFNESNFLFDCRDNLMFKTTPALKDFLDQNLKKIEQNNPFGNLLPWEKVKNIFPSVAKAKVRDLETGLTFNIYIF